MDAGTRLEATYRGHHIAVKATRRSTWWSWSYLIEGRIRGTGENGAQLSAEAALKQGMLAAQVCVDDVLK